MELSKVYFEKIEALRIAQGLTENALCKKADVSSNTLYAWKRRNTMPTFQVLSNLCDALKIPLQRLFGEDLIENLSVEQKEIVELWTVLDPKFRKLVREVMKGFLGLE